MSICPFTSTHLPVTITISGLDILGAFCLKSFTKLHMWRTSCVLYDSGGWALWYTWHPSCFHQAGLNCSTLKVPQHEETEEKRTRRQFLNQRRAFMLIFIVICHKHKSQSFCWHTSSFSWFLFVSWHWYSVLHFKSLRSATEILFSYSVLFPISLSKNLIFSLTKFCFSLISCFILANA